MPAQGFEPTTTLKALNLSRPFRFREKCCGPATRLSRPRLQLRGGGDRPDGRPALLRHRQSAADDQVKITFKMAPPALGGSTGLG